MATRFTYFGFEYEVLEDKKNEVALIDASNAQGRTFIAKEVEYNGQKYAVTQITGKEVDFRYLEHCDSKRHKNSTRYRGAFQPKKHDGKSYSGWGKNTNPIEIIIPYCVTKIGRHTFDGCSGLTSVSIPNNVVDIGEYAFEDCYKLSEITIPDSVTHIGEGAFRFCNGLTSVIIPYGVINIGNSAFDGCYNLKMVTIENGVINIECCAFSRCPSLTSITIPSSVKTIGPSAFKGDSNYKMQLENVRIENE